MRSRCLHLAVSIFALAVTLAPSGVQAIHFSSLALVGVANVSQLTLTPSSGSKITSDGLLGFGGGILTELDLSKEVIGIELGALYGRRVYGDDTTEYTETRVEVPVLLRLHFGGLAIGAGVYGVQGLGEIKNGLGGTTTYEDANRSKLDLGWVGSAAYLLRFGARGNSGILIDARYSKSVTNVVATGDTVGSYTDLQILSGIKFGF